MQLKMGKLELMQKDAEARRLQLDNENLLLKLKLAEMQAQAGEKRGPADGEE